MPATTPRKRNTKLTKQDLGHYTAEEGRFTIRRSNGCWKVVDVENPDATFYPPTLTEARARIASTVGIERYQALKAGTL